MPIEVVVCHTLNFGIYSIMTALADLFREKVKQKKKSLKWSMHNLSKLQQKMEFLDVFKEYRQVSKEAFEVRLQLLIFPLFLNHSFWPKCSWEKKKQNRIKMYIRSQLLLGLSLRQLWWLRFPNAQSRITACHAEHRSSYINPCIWSYKICSCALAAIKACQRINGY